MQQSMIKVVEKTANDEKTKISLLHKGNLLASINISQGEKSVSEAIKTLLNQIEIID